MNRLAVSERRLLLLYWSPGGAHVRAAIGRHLRALMALPGRNRVLAYNATRGAPPWLRRFRPDAVLLHTTFLGLRWIDGFESRRQRSAWLAEMHVPKVALPQDDYDHAAVLDDWLDELGVDVVFSPLAKHAGELLPRISKRAVVRPALTGYVDDDALAARPRPTPLAGRALHLVYRASELPWWFGSFGLLKHRLGEAAARGALDLDLQADVSTRPEDAVIRGWLDFLASGRAVVVRKRVERDRPRGGGAAGGPRAQALGSGDHVEQLAAKCRPAGTRIASPLCLHGISRRRRPGRRRSSSRVSTTACSSPAATTCR